MKLLDRYLSLELTLPFLTGLTGFLLIEIGTLLFNGMIELMLASHTPVGLVALALLYKVPLFVQLALPMAMLFGVSIGINRMAREGEINAMRIAGVSLRRMLLPLLGVGLVVSVGDFYLGEKVVPPASERADRLIQKMWLQSEMPQVQPDTFFHAGNYWFYVGTMQKSADNRFLFNKVMVYKTQIGSYPILTTAQVGAAEVSETGKMTVILQKCRTMNLSNRQETVVEENKITLHVDANLEQFMVAQRKPEAMSTAEINKMIQQFASGGRAPGFLVMFYHLKYSIPASCLVVVLVSMPFAVHFSRSGSFVGFLLSIILFFFYYNTYFLFRLLGNSGFLHPLLAAWGHNVIFSIIGVVMLWREE
jgi:lipopolysaccharide export system permease protein